MVTVYLLNHSGRYSAAKPFKCNFAQSPLTESTGPSLRERARGVKRGRETRESEESSRPELRAKPAEGESYDYEGKMWNQV
jgi:hypothetical protein